MNMRALFLLSLGLALIMPDLAFAQVRRRSSKKSTSSSDYEWEVDEEPKKEASQRKSKKKRSKKKRDEDKDKDEDEEYKEEEAPERPRPMSTKADIEAHLAARIKLLQKFHRGQTLFGQRMSASWIKFWGKVYEDRKQFDAHMARQRLNLFATLTSLDQTSHGATVEDFERLQTGQIKSFEAKLRRRMDAFLGQFMNDLRDFSVDQEKKREQFNRDLMDSWRTQKDRKNGRSKRKRKRKRDD